MYRLVKPFGSTPPHRTHAADEIDSDGDGDGDESREGESPQASSSWHDSSSTSSTKSFMPKPSAKADPLRRQVPPGLLVLCSAIERNEQQSAVAPVAMPLPPPPPAGLFVLCSAIERKEQHTAAAPAVVPPPRPYPPPPAATSVSDKPLIQCYDVDVKEVAVVGEKQQTAADAVPPPPPADCDKVLIRGIVVAAAPMF